MSKSAFFGYPSSPDIVRDTINAAVSRPNVQSAGIVSWENLEIAGQFIVSEVLGQIDELDVLVADVSSPNFNVSFEIGYAIGRGKPVVLTRNKALEDSDHLQRIGIFDTIGYREYENSDQLARVLLDLPDNRPLSIPYEPNQRMPVYLVETPSKTDWMTTIRQ